MLSIKSISQFFSFKFYEWSVRRKIKLKKIKFAQKIIDDGDNLSLARFYNYKGEQIRGNYKPIKKRKLIDSNLHPLEAYYKNK